MNRPMREDPAAPGAARDSLLFARRFTLNTFFNFVGRFWAFLVTLLLTPYTLSRLGVDEFGVWVLLSVFAGSFGILDAGLGWSFIKFVSEYAARRDLARINRVLTAGLLFYLALGGVFLILGRVVGPVLLSVFRVDADLEVLLLVLAAFALNNLGGMLLSMLRGLQRMDESNAVEILTTFPKIAGTIFVLESGLGVFGLASNAIVVGCLGILLGWYRLGRAAPWIQLQWRFDLKTLSELLRYGFKLQVVRLSELVSFQIDRLILARFIGVASVSLYEVGSRLTLFMRALPYVLISVMTPAASELAALADVERLRRMYWLVTRYVLALTVGLVAFVMIEAEALLLLWLGPGFGASAILVRLLAVGYGLNALSAIAGQTASGLGRPEFEMRGGVLLIVLNPCLSLLLVSRFGSSGVALGTTLALAVGAVSVVVLFHRKWLDESVIPLFVDRYLPCVVAALAGAIAVWGVRRWVPLGGQGEETRLEAAVGLGWDLPLFLTVYIVGLIVLRQLELSDWKNFVRIGRAVLDAARLGKAESTA